MPSAKQDDRIPIVSAIELAGHFESIEYALAQQETEDSWQRLDKALLKLEAITKGGGYKFDEFIGHMKAVAGPLTRSLLSERTRLSGTAADVLNSVAPRLADRFEPLVNVYVPPLLLICSRTNKVALKRAEKCLRLIAKHCRLASTIPFLRDACKDKVANLRAVSVANANVLLLHAGRERLGKKVADLECIIRNTATDSSSEVRHSSKELFESYVRTWPERVERFTEQFSPTARRYLCLPKTGPYKPPIEALHKPGEDADRQFKTASSDAENFSYHDTQSVLEEGQHHPLDEGDVFTGSSSRSDSTLPSSKFIQQLAAAKNKNRMPEHMRSTGALKGLSTFAVFNHQGRGRSEGQSFKQPVSSHCDKSRLQPSVPQVDVAKRQARALADVNPSQCQNLFQSRKAAEYLESARVPAPEHKFSTQYQFTEQEAELDRPVPKAIEPARSPAAAGDPSDSVETLLPLARGGGEDGSAAMASSCPSDGVAKRLASIAQQQISPKKTVMITSPTSSTSCKESKAPTHPIFGLTKSTKMDGPKAGRVAVVISKAAVGSNVRRAPAQRQVGASRVERVPHRSTKEIEADLSQKNGAVGSTSVRETSGGNHEVSHVVANGSAAQTKFSKGNYKAANRPMPSSPKKIGPVKTIGKVVSSTTQSLGAKSKILNSSSAGRRATTISAQAAREAVVAKKQAEVAKLRAEAKARNKKAAVCAAETHASMQARTRRLRAATQSNNHNAEQFAPKVASPADGQTEGVPTVQAARLLDTLDLNIPVSRVHADGEVVRKGDENTDDRPERHGLQIDFSATLEVIKSPAEHKQHSPGQHNCAKCVDRDAESPTLTDQSPQAAEESIPARSILSDDLALAFANLTPFRRCRRPNGALDSPADKIRVQMALLFGMSAREENGQSGYGQIGPPLSAQEKALSSPIRGAFDAGCARSALGQHTANGALRGWQSCNTSPLKSRRQIQLCWKETSKENVVCAAENSVAAAWDDGLLR